MIYRSLVPGLLACAALLAGCHQVPTRPAPPNDRHLEAAPGSAAADASSAPADDAKEAAAEAAAADAAGTASNSLPPCLPADQKNKPAPKRKPRLVQHSPPASSPEPEPAAPPSAPSDATLKPIAVSSASILGKQVQSPAGEDLGRVVDVLADTNGHVQIAIIEVGGFLGLGNRRIAVDWALLKFHPEDPQGTVTLNLTQRRLQGAPEYKDSAHALALMAPTTAAPGPVAVPEGKK